MARLVKENGAPQYIRSDNGSEFIEKRLRRWLRAKGIKTIYIEPGSPWQNGYIESFNATDRNLLFPAFSGLGLPWGYISCRWAPSVAATPNTFLTACR